MPVIVEFFCFEFFEKTKTKTKKPEKSIHHGQLSSSSSLINFEPLRNDIIYHIIIMMMINRKFFDVFFLKAWHLIPNWNHIIFHSKIIIRSKWSWWWSSPSSFNCDINMSNSGRWTLPYHHHHHQWMIRFSIQIFESIFDDMLFDDIFFFG